MARGMKRDKGIKLNMNEYRPHKRTMTQQEKIERLFILADKIHVQVGNERNQHDKYNGVLSKKSFL